MTGLVIYILICAINGDMSKAEQKGEYISHSSCNHAARTEKYKDMKVNRECSCTGKYVVREIPKK